MMHCGFTRLSVFKATADIKHLIMLAIVNLIEYTVNIQYSLGVITVAETTNVSIKIDTKGKGLVWIK